MQYANDLKMFAFTLIYPDFYFIIQLSSTGFIFIKILYV